MRALDLPPAQTVGDDLRMRVPSAFLLCLVVVGCRGLDSTIPTGVAAQDAVVNPRTWGMYFQLPLPPA